MSVRLCALTRALVAVNQPLKWDVFSEKGQLLLHKGYIIHTDSQLENLLERGMYANADEVEKSKLDSKPVEYDPFLSWDGLKTLTFKNNLNFIRGKQDEILSGLDQKVAGITMLLQKNQTVALFELMQMDLTNYVAAHNLQTAVLVSILAKKLNWDQTSIETLCRAGATMNIAMLELQSVLTAQKEPITVAQRSEIRSHGTRGREILEKLGVTNEDWLRAVEGHHPGYLAAGSAASEMAGIIHHADVYLAKISPRSFRQGKPPNVAAKEMLQEKGMSQALASVIIKEIGVYPPGSYVKLANGEIAIVTQRGEQVHTPGVFSLLNANGMPLGEPVPRDTGSAAYAISSIVPRNKVMVTFNRLKLFSKKKYTGVG
ncbi:HD-GYP domain-containing protein (c-di-GMP phosphodiesterase class II) [Oxalobacteraceae bacterium GrIS 2.11]